MIKKKYKPFLIGSISTISIVGISIAATSQLLTKAVDYYVTNENIKIGNQKSLFFVTDGGDIRDGSFNEAAYNEVSSISNKYNYEAPTNANYSSLLHAYNLAVARGATIIELNGFLHEQALKEFSKDNPQIGIIYLDSTLQVKAPGSNKLKNQGNVASIWFKTQEVGFLAGYASAAWASQHHKKGKNPMISGVGGQNIPPVVMYLAGFEQGLDYFNSVNKKTGINKVLLYIRDFLHKKTAKYFGGFQADPNGQVTNFTKQAINDGVNVIFPCGGPQTFTVIRTLQNQNISPNQIKVIGVDQNLTNQQYPGLKKNGEWTKYVLASATKSIGNSIASLSNSIFGIHLNGENPGDKTSEELKKMFSDTNMLVN